MEPRATFGRHDKCIHYKTQVLHVRPQMQQNYIIDAFKITLPDDVSRGMEWIVPVRQIRGRTNQILGGFDVRNPPPSLSLLQFYPVFFLPTFHSPQSF